MKAFQWTRLLALVMACLLLTACGSDSDEEKKKPVETVGFAVTEAAEPAETLSDDYNDALYGTFYNAEIELTLEFDGVSEFILSDGEDSWEGGYAYDGMDLLLENGTDQLLGRVLTNGNVLINEYPGEFEYLPDAEFLGQWELFGEDVSFSLYSDYTAEFNYYGEIEFLSYELDEAGNLTFYTEEGDVYSYGVLDEGNQYYPQDMPGRVLRPSEDIPSENPYDALYPANWTPEDGPCMLWNGGRWYYKNDRNNCANLPMTWQIEVVSDTYPGDGTRQVELLLMSAYPREYSDDAPSKDVLFTRQSFLYDKYTGYGIMNDNDFIDGPNHVTFESLGGIVEISTDCIKTKYDSDSEYRIPVTYELTITMPDWYTGLAVAAVSMSAYPDNAMDYSDVNIFDCPGTMYLEDSLRFHLDG